MTNLQNIKNEQDGKAYLWHLFLMVKEGMIDGREFTILITKYSDHMERIPKDERPMLRYRQIFEFQKKDIEDLN